MDSVLAQAVLSNKDASSLTQRVDTLLETMPHLKYDRVSFAMASILPNFINLCRAVPAAWEDGGCICEADIVQASRIIFLKMTPLMKGAVDGLMPCPYREALVLEWLLHHCVSTTAFALESVTAIGKPLCDADWGVDSDGFVSACMDYDHERHHEVRVG